MKANSTIFRFLAVSALALAVPMSAMAGHGGNFASHDRPSADMGRGHGMPELFGIDLTAAQITQLSALRDEQRKLFDDKFKAMRDQREALRKLAMSDTYTPAAAADLSTKIGAAEAEMVKLHAEHGNKLYKILTPEQRTKLQQNILVGGGRMGMGGGHHR